jgi:hypothetical protein
MLFPNRDLKLQIESIQELDIRDDDIYLATYPKCGTMIHKIFVRFYLNLFFFYTKIHWNPVSFIKPYMKRDMDIQKRTKVLYILL